MAAKPRKHGKSNLLSILVSVGSDLLSRLRAADVPDASL